MSDLPALKRFLALGDSFTEGMSDELRPDGRYRGWADRLADALAEKDPELTYAKLAVRGKLLDQVVVEQLNPALRMMDDPTTTLVSFHGGPNDALRPRVDLGDLTRRYDRAVRLLRDSGATVMLFTVIERAGGSGRTAARLAQRFEALNDAIRETATRHGARLVDQAAVPALQDRRMWNPDRLHLAPEGHRRVAALAFQTLGRVDASSRDNESPWWTMPLPPPPPASRSQEIAADVQWLRSHLAPWIGRRLRGVSSGDGVRSKDSAPHSVVSPPRK